MRIGGTGATFGLESIGLADNCPKDRLMVELTAEGAAIDGETGSSGALIGGGGGGHCGFIGLEGAGARPEVKFWTLLHFIEPVPEPVLIGGRGAGRSV